MPGNINRTFATTADILSFIHEVHLKNQAKTDPYSKLISWDCVVMSGVYTEEEEREMNEWSDAAYKGDWDTLFQIAARASWDFALGRLANRTRLIPERDAEDTIPTRKPSGYTALHQAAWHGAPVEVVQGIIELGASRGLRTTDGKHQRPIDIARERRYTHLYSILSADRLPDVSDEDLAKVEAHFHSVILDESQGLFKPESMRFPDLGLLRDQSRVSMQVPGMYGGFNFWWEDGHLVSESYCRIAGGSGRTSHITPDGPNLVTGSWG